MPGASKLAMIPGPCGSRCLAWRASSRRIGIEARGGYERTIVAKLRMEGFEVIVFQPKQVRAYAMFRLQRAKNDIIDAALIAACTAAVETCHAPPDSRFATLAEHLTFIEQIEEDIARGKTRSEGYQTPELEAEIEAEISRLKKRRAGWRGHWKDGTHLFDGVDALGGSGPHSSLSVANGCRAKPIFDQDLTTAQRRLRLATGCIHCPPRPVRARENGYGFYRGQAPRLLNASKGRSWMPAE